MLCGEIDEEAGESADESVASGEGNCLLRREFEEEHYQRDGHFAATNARQVGEGHQESEGC
jgi:hypothetical protein